MLNLTFNKEKTLEALQKMGAERVFIALDILSFNPQKREKMLSMLSDALEFFKATNLEVGVWMWTFWRSDLDYIPSKMEKITAFDGRVAEMSAGCEPTGDISSSFFCPSDKNFVFDTCDFIKKVAALNPDIIMFDDDFR